jgi:hypothetical protein
MALTPRRVGGRIAFDGAAVGALHVLTDLAPDPARPRALRDTPSMLVVVVVTTVPFGSRAGGGAASAMGPAPVLRPSDFVPPRPVADVVLRGASAAGQLTLRVGSCERAFVVASSADATTLERHLASDGGHPAPMQPPEPPRLSGTHRWFSSAEMERFHAAPASLRFPPLGGREGIALALPDGRKFHVELPGLAPRLRVLGAVVDMPEQDVWARLDEVGLDVDRGVVRLAYRALVPTLRVDGRDVERVDVLFADPADAAGAAEPFFDADVPRAAFGLAWTVQDAERGEPPAALSERDLQIARYSAWDGASPLPVVPLALAAQIAAELAEQREERAPLLDRHGLTPYEWEVEERAWAEAMAEVPEPDEDGTDEDEDASDSGDPNLKPSPRPPPRPPVVPTIAELWADAFRRAQDALARPEEAQLTPRSYAELAIALEGPRPDQALQGGIGLGAYQRLDRRMQERASADPAFAAELDALLDDERKRARSRAGPAPFPGLELDDQEAP